MMKKFFGIALLAMGLSAYATPITSTMLGGRGDNQVTVNQPIDNDEHGNIWDLEATLLDGTNLSIVSSYDLKNGVTGTRIGNVTTGDIFIDLNGDATTLNYSPTTSGGEFSNSLVKYDYVYDIDWVTGKYDVYKLDNNSELKGIYYTGDNLVANPFQFIYDNETAIASGSIDYTTGLSDAAGALSWPTYGTTTHNMATVDLKDIGYTGGYLTTRLTMSCGNDVTVGHVPEPSSFLMMLVGLLSLTGFLVAKKRK